MAAVRGFLMVLIHYCIANDGQSFNTRDIEHLNLHGKWSFLWANFCHFLPVHCLISRQLYDTELSLAPIGSKQQLDMELPIDPIGTIQIRDWWRFPDQYHHLALTNFGLYRTLTVWEY